MSSAIKHHNSQEFNLKGANEQLIIHSPIYSAHIPKSLRSLAALKHQQSTPKVDSPTDMMVHWVNLVFLNTEALSSGHILLILVPSNQTILLQASRPPESSAGAPCKLCQQALERSGFYTLQKTSDWLFLGYS